MSSIFAKRPRKQTVSSHGAESPSTNSVPYEKLHPTRNQRATTSGSRSGHASDDSSRSTSRTSSLNGHAEGSDHGSRSSRSDGRERERRRPDGASDSLSVHSLEDPTATPRVSHYVELDHRRGLDRGPSISTVSSRTSALSSAPSTHSLGTQSSRISGASYYNTNILPADADFRYPRPSSDAEVDRLFAEFIFKRGLDKAPSGAAKSGNSSKQQRNVVEEMMAWPADKKWQIVYTEALNQWQASQKKKSSKSSRAISSMLQMPPPEVPASKTHSRMDEVASRMLPPTEHKTTSAIKRDRPEDYLGMFMDGTITAKAVASLNVGLRTYEVSWLASFIHLQGQSVLSTALGKLAREGSTTHPTEAELVLEYEISKCLKTLLNSKSGANDALAHPSCITNTVYAIIAPHLPTRKTVADILIFLSHWESEGDIPRGHSFVLQGFDALQKFRNTHGRFDAWLESLEQTLDGRGRMGSLVGASHEVRSLRGREAASMLHVSSTGQADNALNEYALSNLLLANSLVTVPHDLEVRIHLRSQLEAGGLRRILSKMRAYGHPVLERHILAYEDREESDAARLREAMETNLLTSLTEPSDIVNALIESNANVPRAKDFLVSTLQHLLLIREEGDSRARYFGLIDRLVTSIVMDPKTAESDFQTLVGQSVESMVSRFDDSDRLQHALQETAALKASISRLRREKERADQEADLTADGVLSQLKSKLGRTEEDLRVSRQTTQALQARMDEMERVQQQALAEQDVQTRELFNMLKEARALELVEDNTGILDRKALMEQMEKKLQRTKTIFALEGRSTRSNKPRPSAPAALPSLEPSPSIRKKSSMRKAKERQSQFIDAEDEAVRKHIEDALSHDLGNISPFASSTRPASPAQSTRKGSRPPTPSSGLGRRAAPASPGDPDSTPLASKSKAYPELGLAGPSALPAHVLPKSSFPMGLMDQIRSRGASKEPEDVSSPDLTQGERDSITTAATDETSATSISSPPRPIKSDRRAHSRSGTVDSVTEDTMSIVVPPPAPPPPPPPAPPPLPPVLRASSALSKSSGANDLAKLIDRPSTPVSNGAPTPPPPPPMPALKSSLSSASKPGNAALMESIRAKASPDGRTTMVEVPEGSSVARPGSIVVPPVPFAPVAPRIPSFAKTPRKEVAVMARQQLKQLQWDNLPQVQADKTIWAKDTDIDENEVASMLKKEGILAEMEEDFRAQQAKLNVAKKQQAKKQLKSVLNSASRQRIEIVLKKASSTETDIAGRITDLSTRIMQFDESLCTDAFLQELKSILPSAEDIGKLNVYRNAPDEELFELHHADRFLVQLIKLPRLNQRVDGMLYLVRFDELYEQQVDLASRGIEACEALQNAKHFRDLLNLILLFGNYMNANGLKGGAFGFRVSSINKLVDTKASNGATLLQFLEKTVRGKFPDMETFLDELAKPAACAKLNLDETRKELVSLRTGLQTISKELNENFADLDLLPAGDGYAHAMWPFVREAGESLSSLVDKVTLATSAFSAVLSYFGEDHRPYTSSEFFGIFQEFVTSYKKAKAENARVAEEQALIERRRKANVDRTKREEEERARAPADAALVDDLLTKLRDGDLKGGRAARNAARKGSVLPTTIVPEAPETPDPVSPTAFGFEDPGELARGLLQQLQGDGFEEVASPPRAKRPDRRERLSHASSFSSSRPGSEIPSRTVSPPNAFSRPESPLKSASLSSTP